MNANEQRAISECDPERARAAAGASEGLQKVTRVAMHLTRGSGSALAVEVGPGRTVCLASSGLAPAMGTVLDRDNGITGICLRSGEVQVVEDAESDLRVDAATCRELGIRSLLLVPVRREERVIGVLSVYSSEVRQFQADDGATLEQLRLLAELVSDSGPSPAGNAESLAAAAVEPASHSLAESQKPEERAPASVPSEEPDRTATSAPATAEFPFRLGAAEPERRPRVPATLIILLALGLAVVAWSERGQWAKRHGDLAGPAPSRAGKPLVSPAPAVSAPVLPAAAAPKPPEPLPVNSGPREQEPAAPADLATVGAVRYSLEGGTARAIIDIDREVYYRGARLENPARAYFDLRGARLAKRKQETVAVGKGGLLRVRISQYDNQTVRIVLDLAGPYDCSAGFATNPSRLVIAVMPRGLGR